MNLFEITNLPHGFGDITFYCDTVVSHEKAFYGDWANRILSITELGASA